MIQAVLFDLDGTLVQTEKLKAVSYARAAVELRPDLDPDEVIAAFGDVVGLSRREVASRLLERFGFEAAAAVKLRTLGVSAPWQAYVQLRLAYYRQLLADPEVLRRNQWPHAVALLHAVRERGCKVALATMSHCEQVTRVLEVLGLTTAFDFVATRDDVTHGKPDPEIYLLAAHELAVAPRDCLVIEDSPAGVLAAANAGMAVVAVATPFTRKGLHALPTELQDRAGVCIVDDPRELLSAVAGAFASDEE